MRAMGTLLRPFRSSVTYHLSDRSLTVAAPLLSRDRKGAVCSEREYVIAIPKW
jgi:hypothetical protein